MRGWHRERVRHSLAARGIRTAMPARALIRPSGEPDPRHVPHLYSAFGKIDDLRDVLLHGLGYKHEGVKGGLSTNEDIGVDSTFDVIGQIYVELKPDIMLKHNDLIKVDYNRRFFKENPDIVDRVSSHHDFVEEGGSINYLIRWYAPEEELVSRNPISIPVDAVKRIEINYAGSVNDPITGKQGREVTDEGASYRLAKRVIREVKKEIPRGYWDLIWLNNQTTGERQRLMWLT